MQIKKNNKNDKICKINDINIKYKNSLSGLIGTIL